MKIQKPAWLLYAAEVRLQIDDMKPTKSGKRETDRSYRAWLEATGHKKVSVLSIDNFCTSSAPVAASPHSLQKLRVFSF